MHLFAEPIIIIICVTEHGKRAQLTFKIILSFSAKLRLPSILGKTFLAAIQEGKTKQTKTERGGEKEGE